MEEIEAINYQPAMVYVDAKNRIRLITEGMVETAIKSMNNLHT